MSPFAPARPIGCRASGKQPITFESLPECTAEISALTRNELDPCLTPAAGEGGQRQRGQLTTGARPPI